MIRTNTSNIQRYRNALGDLAHSLKTPLAVIKSALDADKQSESFTTTISDQVEQLDKTINYQLQRAAAAGRPGLARPIDVRIIVGKIASSLRKVYAAKELHIEEHCLGRLRISGDEGDMMEMIGNISDNACKWARANVTISASELKIDARRALVIEISDDGPGMPSEKITDALQRGTRLDQAMEGQGIGLAVVRELCEQVYQGKLEIDSSPAGTNVQITLPI